MFTQQALHNWGQNKCRQLLVALKPLFVLNVLHNSMNDRPYLTFVNVMLDADAVINNSSQKVGGSNAYRSYSAPEKVGGSGPRKTHRIYAPELFISRFDKVTLHFAAGCSVRSRTVACGCSECNCCAAGDGPSPAAAMAAGVPTQPEPGTPLQDRAGVEWVVGG